MRVKGEAALAELREANERLSTILEHAPVMIDAVDSEGKFTIWNRECVRRLGWTREELDAFEAPLSVFYPDPEVLKRVLDDIARSDGRFREYEVLSKDGLVRTQLWANFRLPNTGATISVGHDVAEQRAMEAQLRQSQKMEALGQLTGGIAHDFNNLLTVILASTELLARRASGMEAQLLVQIRQAATDGAELVRQLVSFSRQSRLTIKVVDLRAALEEITPTLRRLLPESISVTVRHGDGELAIEADRIALEQVIINLATNARDAMECVGELTLTTRVARAPDRGEPDREYVVLRLRDNGAGMAPEVRERAFEPFFTTKPPGKGTGLGLPTVYGLAAQHGGFVELWSEPGHGTLVEVFFVRAERPVDAAPAPPPASHPTGRETILLVEDEPSLRVAAKQLLELLGYRVLLAVDGVDALRVLDTEHDVALVLSDVVMPRMTGPELLEALRARGPMTSAFAFLSGYTMRETAGAVDPSVPLIEKPFSIAALAPFVRSCIDGQKTAGERDGAKK
jgi:PAS domain S-box-containing protein